MRKVLLLLCLLGLNLYCLAQSPVRWTFSAASKGNNVYEIQLSAKVEQPWHIHSEFTPDGGPLPPKFIFNKNPLVSLDGKTKETGTLITKYEDVFGVNVKYFDGQVTFVQRVKLKSKVKTNISGKIQFMACNDEMCLPPAEIPFTVQLN